MPNMGKFCKAYPISRLREYDKWEENSLNVRNEDGPNVAGSGGAEAPENDYYLFLQEDFTVTQSIYLDERVVFDNVSPEWVEFCKNNLRFEVSLD